MTDKPRTRPSRTRLAIWTFAAAAFGLLVLLAVASWILRDQIYQSFLDPGEPYQTYTVPPAPDYTLQSSWYARPAETATGPAIFFVHGTTYPGGREWNAAIDAEAPSNRVVEEQLPNFAAPFSGLGALYAPRYRQAALYTFMNRREDGIAARLTAAQDVRAAFAEFFGLIGDEVPFIIVGAGQGGMHALAVLMEDVAPDPNARRRLVAAYILESQVPLDLLESVLADLPACSTPDDFRCIFSYVSSLSDNDARIRILTEVGMVWNGNDRFAFVEGRGLLCVNPILGARTTDYAPARLHRGGAHAAGFREGAVPAALPAQTGAQCLDGVLMTELPRSRSLQRPGRLAENYRLPPFNLFYEDLRADATHRLEQFLPVFASENELAPPLGQPEEVDESPFIPIPDRADGG
ncbi:DUF3089 domain-containing protein [Hyphobacterium sp.]|uniref:DUF3089 domain-containing protein n=1 Tax=Hyphobacterium sp. TaxID=2004662 RepID=UPI003BAC8A84